MKKLAQGFNTAAHDSNPGSLSRESGGLPLSHCTVYLLFIFCTNICRYGRVSNVYYLLVLPAGRGVGHWE